MQWQEFQKSLRHLPPPDQERVRRAWELCAQAHEGQTRKSGEPYATHPIAVAHTLTRMNADADTLVAALLHDTLEDTPLTLEHIRTRFGSTAASLIEGLTKLRDEAIRGHPTLDEEIESLRKIVLLMQEDVRIMVIKLADRLHNMQTVAALPKERQEALAQETMDLYVKIAERLGMQDLSDELEGLALGVLDPPLALRLQGVRAQNAEWAEEVVKEMQETLYAEPLPLPRSVTLLYEQKTWGHLRARLGTEEAAVSGRSDVTVAFLCETIAQCYETLGILHQKWPLEIGSFKDFINTPAMNGYRGIHTTVLLRDGTRVRCKIRTKEMHAYARKGVTTLCFDHKAIGLLGYLPWTECIAPLSKDTADKSEEFWDSLQSDILGKSIIIYGPDNTAVQLPAGSTALDGACYLFKERTLSVTAIKINGKDASFFTPLARGVSLAADFADHPTVTREWLEWVRTGVAIALIRSALGAASRQQKIENGMKLLQEAMTSQARGYLKEFREEGLLAGLRTLGYSTLDDAYSAIADGHLKPSVALSAIFQPKKERGKATPQKQHCTVSFSMPTMSLREVADHFSFIEEKYGITLPDIRLFPTANGHIRVTVRCPLSTEEQQSIATELAAGGAEAVKVLPAQFTLKQVFIITLIVILWGLDPVFARQILTGYPISAYDLTAIRFLTLFFTATIGYGIQSLLARKTYKPLSPRPTLFLSAAALFLTAISTYVALSLIPPTQYILFVIGGVVLSELIRHRAERTTRWWRLLIALCATIVSLGFLVSTQGHSLTGLLFAALSSFGFALYSRMSGSYQRGVFHARYPAFLFWLSVLCMPFVFLLLPVTDLRTITFSSVLIAIGFVGVFSILPYGIYYEGMRRFSAGMLDNALPFVLFSTVVGEALSTRFWTPLAIIPLLLVFLWHYASVGREAV